MMVLEACRVAWLGVFGNKMRSFLTILGVIIGVSAVITLVSVGEGTTLRVTSNLTQLGSNLIIVNPRGQSAQLELKDLPDLLQKVPHVTHVLPTLMNRVTVRSDLLSYDVVVEGVTEDYPIVRERSAAEGFFIEQADVQARRRVAVLGTTAVEKLFGPGANPIGQQIRLLTQTYTVIGIAEKKGTGITGIDNDDRIFVPITTLQRAVGNPRLGTLYLKMQDGADAPTVVQEVTDYYAAKFRRDDQVTVQSQDQLLETIGENTRILTMMLGSIAGISLLVGGIGIMNIMLVSVSERTREIGIRKAIGAKKRDVLAQFLVEALMLSLSGGAIGILLGYGGSRGLSTALGLTTLVSPMSVMVSFGFSAAVGVFFGLYPAIRAANLDPIEALRRE